MPGRPRVGTPAYYQQQVPGEEATSAQVVKTRQSKCVPFRCFKNVVVILEGGEEYKYYAPGVGGIRTEPRSSGGPQETEDLINVRQLGAGGLGDLSARSSSSTSVLAGSARRVRRFTGCGTEALSAHPQPERATAIVRVDGVWKTFREGETETAVLCGVDLELARHETTSLVGSSGSGKSTLISVLAGLLLPEAGSVLFDGSDMTALDDTARARLRAGSIGVVLQRGNLIPFLTAVENVELAMGIAGRPRRAQAPASCSSSSASGGASTTVPARSRGARRSGSRSQSRWRTSPICCSPTR